MSSSTNAPITKLEEIEVYQNRWLSLRFDRVKFEKTGKEGRYSVLVEGGNGKESGVVVVPILHQTDAKSGVAPEKVVMIKQFRYPVSAWSWEFPRGFCEMGVTAENQALRELEEETGIKPELCKKLVKLTQDGCEMWTNNGISNSKVVYYAALIDSLEGMKSGLGEDEESIEKVKAFTVDEVKEMVRKGEIRDQFATTGFALALLGSHLHIQ
ncbi:hypothetical protein HK098_008025 [Nowakowskiella sp. JEL0407]|nr:hypothetical protein HK098_008025 [Nowakowskiella sp. JEL0407]